MDGFELLQWIRRNQPGTRVIMMTAFGSPTSRQEALKGGVIAFLEKPFDLHVLKDELAKMADAGSASPPPGRVDEYDLLEVAQVLNLSRRDIALSLQSGGQMGRLRFLRGEPIWAEYGTLRGNEAFLALGAAKGVQMQPEPWDGRSERNVTQPFSRLSYQALALREGKGITHPPILHAAPAGQAASLPPTTPAETATLTTSARALTDESLTTLAGALPQPHGIVLMRLDGGVLSQRWQGIQEVPLTAFGHLVQAAQAAARAMLVGDLGSLEALRFTTAEYVVLARRLGRADKAGLLVVLLPAGADEAAASKAMQAQTAALLDLLR